MDINFINDNLSTLYLENIENYVVINEEMYKAIVSSIECNYLLILFTMSCFIGILCSMKKSKNDYVLIQNVEPIKGQLIEKV